MTTDTIKTTGKKLGSTQKFNQNGVRIPITGIALDSAVGFSQGDLLKITGISKGKGFSGVVKRHGFKGGPHTHGQSDRERHAGSIGQTTTPGRVYRGKRMAGRMGGEKVTIKGVVLLSLEEKEKRIWVKGLLPGQENGKVTIVKYSTAKKYVPLMEEGTKAEIVPDEEKIKEQLAQQAAQQEKEAEEVKQESKSEEVKGEENA